MKSLTEFAKSKSNFISIKAGESYVGIYKGYKFIEKDSFGETKEYARYLLEDLKDEVVRNLDSQSASFAEQMEKVEFDSKIEITREGEGMDTKYKVEVLDITDEETPTVEDENA